MNSGIIVPAEPMETSASSNANVHRLRKVSPNQLVLAPGNALLIWAAALILIGVLAFVVCNQKGIGGGAMAAIAGAPLFAAAGFGIAGFIYAKFGTRATFDVLKGEVVVTGARHKPERRFTAAEIHGVQLCDAGRRGEEGSWHSYQVNLVVRGGEDRINLLDSAGEGTLRGIAREIAQFWNVPLFEGSKRVE